MATGMQVLMERHQNDKRGRAALQGEGLYNTAPDCAARKLTNNTSM